MDDEGFLRITDRKKDLIKTSGGTYVAPQSIETTFTVACAWASEIVVYGEGRPGCTALVALDPAPIASWADERPQTTRFHRDQRPYGRGRTRATVRRQRERRHR